MILNQLNQPEPRFCGSGFTANRMNAKYIPWKIKTAIAFTDEEKSLDFENYLKTASSRALDKKTIVVRHP